MVPKMRTIDQAAAWLRETDPETAFTKTALRRMVVSGELPGVVRVGSKYLLNLDILSDFLQGAAPAPAPVIRGIRRVEL